MRNLIIHHVVHHAVNQKEIVIKNSTPYLTCGFLCVYYNGYYDKCVLYVFTLAPQYSEHYAVKTSPSTYTLTSSTKRTRSTTSITLLPTLHRLIPAISKNCHFQTWLRYQPSDLASLPAKTLRSQLKVINYLP